MEKEEWFLDWEIRGFYTYAEKSFFKDLNTQLQISNK
jgi:hypothetical protein